MNRINVKGGVLIKLVVFLLKISEFKNYSPYCFTILDEIKQFFNQLDSLKSSFRPWTKKLKQILQLEGNEQKKDEIIDLINNEEIINQFQIILNGQLESEQKEKNDKIQQKLVL
ncbi:hypothetical protein BpHYR1_009632 [Brachionus plicatilis]|uniref:Uncharacterized protein n=1 Tax=Brachionus plicatilis TaxID=10195 RepID=A0A3M7SY79_BRAPC|nr:hypothetical protein BpHYR1_009632 [Brachionus plicatilis]